MKQIFLRYMVGFVVGVVAALTVVIVLLSKSNEVTTLKILQASSPIAILVSALIALFLYFENVKKNNSDKSRQRSESYLNEAKELLERAYRVFVNEDGDSPSNENMNWRTAALLILKSKELEKNVTEQDHKVTFDGHKQYYAVQFHRVLWANVDNMDMNYFMPSGNPTDVKAISRKAIAVIFQFAHSISSDYERLDNIDSAPILASSVPPEFLGVENFIGQYQGLWERVQDYRKNQVE